MSGLKPPSSFFHDLKTTLFTNSDAKYNSLTVCEPVSVWRSRQAASHACACTAQCHGASGRSSSSFALSMAASMWMTTGLSPTTLAGTWTDKTVNTEYLQGAQGGVIIEHEATRRRERRARHKQELQLVLHALHRLLHQVHVLAAVAQRVLPARVEVNDPVNRHLT